MKINEVIHEGIMNTIKGFIPGTAANTQRLAANAQQQKIKQLTKGTLQKWAAYSQNLKAAGKPITPDEAVNWFSSFSNIPATELNTIAPLTSVDSSALNTWLGKQLGNYLAKKTVGTTPAAPSAGQQSQTTTPDTTTQGTIGALGKRSSAPATTTAPSYQSPLGITVRQATDPVILDYKGKAFMLNNRGEWALDGKDTAGAQASAPLQAEMDKVLGYGK